jgi:tRNA(fMet)-specific endonuclease VapC
MREVGAAVGDTPNRFLLDTDTVVDLLRGRADVGARLRAVSSDQVRISAMTVAELAYGARRSRDPVARHAEIERFCSVVRVVTFGTRAALAHARLREALRSAPVGPADLVIAATAIAQGATVITSNLREFARMPGVNAESWRTS